MLPTPFALQRAERAIDHRDHVQRMGGAVEFCVATNQGQRRYQEDRAVAATLGDVAMCAVMDGHSSARVSSYLQRQFEHFVLPNLATRSDMFKDPPAFARLIDDLYKTIDKNTLALQGGSTAVAAFYNTRTRRLYLVNVGDSRAVAVDVTNNLWAATVDHKPGEASERNRINQLGGFVSSDSAGVTRVQGNLSVSRSFGDAPFRPYVSANPVVYGPYLVTGTAVVVLGSDGVFDVVSNQDVERMVTSRESYTTLCNELVQLSLDKGSSDNITAVAMVMRK